MTEGFIGQPFSVIVFEKQQLSGYYEGLKGFLVFIY